MSSSNSSSTLWILIVFVLGLGVFLFFRFSGDEEEPFAPSGIPARVTHISPSPPPPLLFEDPSAVPGRDAVMKGLRERSGPEPEDAEERLGYGLGLILDPASAPAEVRTGVSILSTYDIRTYGGFTKLRKDLLDPEAGPRNRRKILLRYLRITERRVDVLRSVLRDRQAMSDLIPSAPDPTDGFRVPDGFTPGTVVIEVDPDIARRISAPPLRNGIRLEDGSVRTIDDLPAGVLEPPND